MSQDSSSTTPGRPLSRTYDKNFQTGDAYRDTLPDPQNNGRPAVVRADARIAQVGVSNFRLPLRYRRADGSEIVLETSILGSVPCPSGRKGINMSRIVRGFYAHKDRVFTPAGLEPVLRDYCEQLGSTEARLKLSFNYPMLQRSLRSGMAGYQYYTCAYEGRITPDGTCHSRIVFDFVYSSACPCSADLADHAEDTRGQYSVPHSQRSKARVWLDLAPGAEVTLEAVQAMASDALKTETQVLVRRDDEQAFAELNGAHLKFVEDAARQLFEAFDSHPDITDFQIACAHLESLHSHDAVAVVTKGIPGGFSGDFDAFKDLIV